MDANVIQAVIAAIGDALTGTVTALIPIGTTLAASFVLLSILFFGASVATGSAAIVPIAARMTAAAAGTLWAIREWDTIVLGTLDAARRILGLLIPGYGNPVALFTMAIEVASRIEAQHVAWNWMAPLASAVAAGLAAVVPLFVLVGFSLIGMLAVLAEFELLLASAAAPLILPALAFQFTAPLGWGPIRFLVESGVRVVMMGAMAHILAVAITSVISLPGRTEALTSSHIWVLALLSLFSILAAFSANGLASRVVGGGMGALGIGSVARPIAAGMAAGRMIAAPAVSAGAAAAGSAACASQSFRGGGKPPGRTSDGGDAFS